MRRTLFCVASERTERCLSFASCSAVKAGYESLAAVRQKKHTSRYATRRRLTHSRQSRDAPRYSPQVPYANSSNSLYCPACFSSFASCYTTRQHHPTVPSERQERTSLMLGCSSNSLKT